MPAAYCVAYKLCLKKNDTLLSLLPELTYVLRFPLQTGRRPSDWGWCLPRAMDGLGASWGGSVGQGQGHAAPSAWHHLWHGWDQGGSVGF